MEYIIFIVTGIKPDRKQSYDNYTIGRLADEIKDELGDFGYSYVIGRGK